MQIKLEYLFYFFSAVRFFQIMSSSEPKRIRVSSLVNTDTPSYIRLRPRAAETTPPARRSYRIVSRPSESAPSIIRVAREPSLTSALENVSIPPVPVSDTESVSIASSSSVIDLEAHPTPAPQAPGTPLSISSAESYESTLSSDSWDTESPEQPDPYRHDYIEFVSQLFRDQMTRDDERVTQLVSARTVPETSENRPELIEVLKFHSGRCVCVVCRRQIAMADICVDYRPRTPAGMIKHCHFGCIDSGTPLYFPSDERLIRFDPQFDAAEKVSYLNQMRARLPSSENSAMPIHPLVRPGDPDRRIQRQRDFINQELARRNRQQNQMRNQIEARRYIDSRREVLSRMIPQTSFGYNQHMFQPGHRPVCPSALSRGVLYSLPRMTVPSSSVPTPEESDDGKDSHCVI